MQLGVKITTSLAKEVMFSVALVCLSVYKQHYSKSYQQIVMKFSGRVRGGNMKKWLKYGGGLGLLDE